MTLTLRLYGRHTNVATTGARILSVFSIFLARLGTLPQPHESEPPWFTAEPFNVEWAPKDLCSHPHCRRGAAGLVRIMGNGCGPATKFVINPLNTGTGSKRLDGAVASMHALYMRNRAKSYNSVALPICLRPRLPRIITQLRPGQYSVI